MNTISAPSPSPSVAVISTHQMPMPLPQGEIDVVPALERAGAAVTTVSWHDPVAKLDAFDHVVMRTPWDYPSHPAAFTAFVASLGDIDAKVHNPAAVMQWNTHKGYLCALAETSPVIETVLIRQGDTLDVSRLIEERQWKDGAVEKPAIGGGAVETYVRKAGCEKRTASADTLVQPFWADIGTRGELSLIYLAGEYSHTVEKVPQSGDFRVQSEHGGSVRTVAAPPDDAKRAADQVLRAAGEAVQNDTPLTYARVDGIMTNEGFRLMELELIEPELFLEWSDGAADRFAAAILR